MVGSAQGLLCEARSWVGVGRTVREWAAGRLIPMGGDYLLEQWLGQKTEASEVGGAGGRLLFKTQGVPGDPKIWG